ncbi:HutD/Ves family protein [Pectinatus cerevisiiphilus]|uniref:HutD protein n=1 Tax=Pectinatus cerevisiiphilus TaxID=86956 RepID=A0A4R3K8I8_9FIRM|nr:HutD family protein [Pectinatus cerevisiiphilus]TCS79316.1 HutD protein [Pectinatus cerevisiiphilus]
MSAKIISAAECPVAEWGGGTTTQLYIWPHNSQYKDRSFKLRLSSATVTTNVSQFTELTGIDRILMSLDNVITLIHNGQETIKLMPFTAHFFDGADKTISYGCCTDFNVMLKHGAYKNAELFTDDSKNFVLETDCDYFIYVVAGKYKIVDGCKELTLCAGKLLHLDGHSASTVISTVESAKIVICKIEW